MLESTVTVESFALEGEVVAIYVLIVIAKRVSGLAKRSLRAVLGQAVPAVVDSEPLIAEEAHENEEERHEVEESGANVKAFVVSHVGCRSEVLLFCWFLFLISSNERRYCLRCCYELCF